jgi:hypothetical protein
MISSCSLCICISLCAPLNFFVFSAVRVVSKESGRLVLPRTFCLYSVYCLDQRINDVSVDESSSDKMDA